MENKSSEPISVEILDREYQFACEPGERAALKAAAIHADTDGAAIGFGRIDDFAHAGRIADIAGVDAQAVDAIV